MLVNIHKIKVDKPFYVVKGNWEGVVTCIEGHRYLKNTMGTYPLKEEDPNHSLDITYLEDYIKEEESEELPY